ncbi:MAG: hypothetical protein U1E78_03180 [Gammaproteobacteria bacterium]
MLLNRFHRTPQKNQKSIRDHLDRAESSLNETEVNKVISDILKHLPLALQTDKVIIQKPTKGFLQADTTDKSHLNQEVRKNTSKLICKV